MHEYKLNACGIIIMSLYSMYCGGKYSMWSRIRCDVRSFANNDLILDQPNRAQPWGIYLILMMICINMKI